MEHESEKEKSLVCQELCVSLIEDNQAHLEIHDEPMLLTEAMNVPETQKRMNAVVQCDVCTFESNVPNSLKEHMATHDKTLSIMHL